MTPAIRMFGIVALIWAFTDANAQSGPDVPCAGCETRIFQPYPSSGPWANTDQNGSGFLLNVQGGTIAGFYFGYDTEGRPEWLLFNGALQSNEENGDILWQLEAPLSRFSGGSCRTCAYEPPAAQEPVGTVRLKFFQPNHASFQIDSADEQYMVPLLYGSAGYAHFAEFTPYLLPELGSDDANAERGWVLSIHDDKGDTDSNRVRRAVTVNFLASELTENSEGGVEVSYQTLESESLASPAIPVSVITCLVVASQTQPGCRVSIVLFVNFSAHFTMPLGNLSANRFFAENEYGLRIEGFRLGYD